jgi:hypothetical protein
MAASPAVRNLEALPAFSPAIPQAPRQSHVVRTPLHAMQTGVGGRSVRRQITPHTGFALGVLGHAIEYLADEYVHEASSILSVTAHDPRMQAIQLLMAANREVYYSCTLMPSLGQRLRRRLFPWA